MATRSARTAWNGSLQDGSGQVELSSSRVGTYDVSQHVPSTTAATAANGTILSSGGIWTTYTTAGACGVKLLLENDSNTGEFATMRLRARASNVTASGNGGNSVGTTSCIDASASAQNAEYGNLFAVNACAQPNAHAQTTDATNIVCALYGRVDATAASAGRRWVSWIDTHATTIEPGWHAAGSELPVGGRSVVVLRSPRDVPVPAAGAAPPTA